MTRAAQIKMLIIEALAAAALLFAFWISAAAADTTSTLAATCAANVSDNGVITWSASSTGGAPPYTYLWDGDPAVSGTVASSVATAFLNPGTHQAILKVTDANGAIANANCSGSIATISNNVSGVKFAGLQMGFFVNHPTPAEGDEVDYGVIVIATGPATSTNVQVLDQLPKGVTFLYADPSEGSYESSTGIWTIGDMAPNARANLTLAVTPDPGTHGQLLTNTASVSEDAALINENGPTSVSESILVQAPTSTIALTPETATQVAPPAPALIPTPVAAPVPSTVSSTDIASLEAQIQALFLQVQQLASIIQARIGL